MKGTPIYKLAFESAVFTIWICASVAQPAAAADDNRGPMPLDNMPTSVSTSRSSATPRSSIRVDVDLALIPVTVVDPLGRNVVGLQRENFQIFDGGKEPRQIVSFSRDDAPVSVGIIFDSSGSMTTKIVAARAATSELFRQLNPEDEAFVVGVADRAEIKMKMGSDFSTMADTLMFSKAGGMTSLLDAVYLGLNRLRRARNPRKALVIVSDGGDNNSRYTLKDVQSCATEAETQIYTIGLVDNPHSPEEAAGPQLLDQLTSKTGGRAFVVQTASDMQNAMARIGITLHNEYLLGYYPPDGVQSGKYRKVKVELKLPAGVPRLQIYARRGYYTPNR